MPYNWEFVCSDRGGLEKELGSMYWDGVKQELEAILDVLHRLQQPKHYEALKDLLPSHRNEEYGFETFIDQVSESSHDFAKAYGNLET